MPAADLPASGGLPLAVGELGERDAAELLALERQVQRVAGFPFGCYKERYLRRRLAVRMRARGVQGYGGYARLLAADPGEYGPLLDTLTINVSRFFRNPEVWQVVRTVVLPSLAGLTRGRVRIWSAGCAGGEEPYSASIMLRERADEPGTGPVSYRILGTDIDAGVLELARKGEYPGHALADTPGPIRARWFTEARRHRLVPEARRNVSFERHDLLRDPFPAGQHLIFCRNVLIYFRKPLQEELCERLRAALVPGGYLVLGKVEALARAASRSFEPVSARHRVFRRK